MHEFIEGLIAAPVVPLHPDGTINTKVIAAYADLLARNGVEGVFVNGTTGEGLSLTTEERKTLTHAWVATAPKKFKIIVQVGHTSLEESRALAKHAQDVGAWGIGSIGSIFFKPAGPKHIAEHCSKIASAAPNLPFYYYHIPSLTGINFQMADLLPLVGDIPNFHGIKYTFETLMDFELCRRYQKGKYNMLYGRDEMYLAALAMGGRGAVGSTYNAFAPLYHRMAAAFDRHDIKEAQQLQNQSHDLIQAMLRTGSFFAALKHLMKKLGIDCGGVRAPLEWPKPEKLQNFESALELYRFDEVKMR
jgi:N-acetylneuraminate lyase